MKSTAQAAVPIASTQEGLVGTVAAASSSIFLQGLKQPGLQEALFVPITVEVTAHHMGHYEFRVCDQVVDSSMSNPDACLNKWVLERATPEEAAAAFGFSACSSGDTRPFCTPFDEKHPERWYLPPRGEVDGTHTVYFKVPAGLQCEACTLQWHWWTANSCQPAGDYGCYKDDLVNSGYWTGGSNKKAWWTAFSGTCSGPAGPNGQKNCGEQFWNCADIAVLPSGGSPARPPAPWVALGFGWGGPGILARGSAVQPRPRGSTRAARS